MNSEGQATAYIANSGKACISTELADLIHDKVQKNQTHKIGTIQQELCMPEKKKHRHDTSIVDGDQEVMKS